MFRQIIKLQLLATENATHTRRRRRGSLQTQMQTQLYLASESAEWVVSAVSARNQEVACFGSGKISHKTENHFLIKAYDILIKNS